MAGGRSQRHKVKEQGVASNGETRANDAYPHDAYPGAPGEGEGEEGLPALSISALNPNTGAAGGANLTVTITGTGFTAGSTAVLGVVDLPTTFVSETSLTCVIQMSGLLAGTQQVKVRRVATNSNQLPFIVT